MNIQNNSGRTALMIASSNRHEKIIEMLTEAGADINIKSNNQETAEMLRNKPHLSEISKEDMERIFEAFSDRNDERALQLIDSMKYINDIIVYSCL